MLKQSINTAQVADAALAASRQVWLAGLGAAMVTRDWARNDAGHVFRALVKEGSTVEARAKRAFGRQLDLSIAVASDALAKAKTVALATVNGVVENAVAALPKFKAQVTPVRGRNTRTKPAKRAARKIRRGKRSTRKA
jgi:Poly(hydroxyalcanoate) granule associated protein (phasin)